jgi:hypothetical protein
MSDLYADPDAVAALAGARAAVVLIGGYDGSANYGDIAQFDAAGRLVERLGPDVAVLAVVEALHRPTHARLYPAAEARYLRAMLYYSPGPDEAHLDGLVPATLPVGIRAAAAYLYGGGYFNGAWGGRKLAMLQATERFLLGAGLPLAGVATSGLQVEPDWLAEVDPETERPLRHARRIGVRDAASGVAVAAAERTPALTGDDAIGCLLPWIGSANGAGPTPRQINVHVSGAGWVTEDDDALLRHYADVLSALAESGTRFQPLIAYDDPHTSERPAAARLRELCIERGITAAAFADPLPALPSALDVLAPAMAAGELTLSCSYHVALTSLLLGVPAALVTENPYYEQKADGLRADFGLPDAFAVRPGEDPDATALALVAALPAARSAIAEGRPAVVERRLRAERDVLAELARMLLARATGGGDDDTPTALALALLRADYQTLAHTAAAHRRSVTSAEAELAASRRERDHLARALESADEARVRLEAAAREAGRAEQERRAAAEQALARILSSQSWRLTAGPRAIARWLRRSRR